MTALGDDGPRTVQHRPFFVTCPQCDGTGKTAGMDCPGCAIDELNGFPTGQILVKRIN